MQIMVCLEQNDKIQILIHNKIILSNMVHIEKVQIDIYLPVVSGMLVWNFIY